MKRRTVLVSAGTAVSSSLAGCPAADGTGGDDRPGSRFPGVAVDPDEATIDDVEMDVEVLRQFDRETPTRIRISFRNVSDEQRRFQFLDVRPFGGLTGHHLDRDEALFIDPGGEIDASMPPGTRPEEPTNGCWRVDQRG